MKIEDHSFTNRLLKKSLCKYLLDVQRPYRNDLRSLILGKTLDISCGIGRNLNNQGKKNSDVGIKRSVSLAQEWRSRGITAFTPVDFINLTYAVIESFGTILVAHVLGRLSETSALDLIRTYITYLKPNGIIMIISPQEAGFRSDPTHVTMMHPFLVKKIN